MKKLGFGAAKLSKLVTNQDANVMWLTTAALFPMIFLVGGGVDLSRAYMVKTRLQAACDSGSLAGRRAMANNEWSDAAKTKAIKMFNANFRSSDYDAKNTVFNVSANDRDNVIGEATTKLPPMIFGAFGAPDFELSANCESELNITDIDVAFVLDVTGSMACPADDEDCDLVWNNTTQAQVENSSSKLRDLRLAVSDFDTSVKGAAGQNTEIRYAFVPYSAKVRALDPRNPDSRLELSASYVRNQYSYRTRKARFTYSKIPISYTNVGNQESAYQSSTSRCQNWATNYGQTVTSSGTTYRYIYINYYGSTCYRQKQQINYTNGYAFTQWVYGPASMSTSDYTGSGAKVFQGTLASDNYIPANKWPYSSGTSTADFDPAQLGTIVSSGNVIGIASNNFVLSRWKGCVEEADTVATLSFSSIPNGAKDFDFFNAPSSGTWKPAWGDVIYGSNGFHPVDAGDACPKVMRRLAEMSASELNNYLSATTGFLPVGATYHDVGMLWGVRMLAHGGVFGADQKDQVSRHIIFMSDGSMSPNPSAYAAYGHEINDGRISGTTGISATSLANYHNNRYVAACDAAKARGITVWVIAFGTTMTSQMTSCASPGKTFSASNSQQLTQAFRDIASRIADLRVVQ